MNQFALFSQIFKPKPVMAQGVTWSGTCISNDVATIQGFECLFGNVLRILIGAAGIVFFFSLIIGGFKYLNSGGDPKKIAAAKSAITLSFISVIGVIVSWLILLFIQKFTGVNVTEFKIG